MSAACRLRALSGIPADRTCIGLLLVAALIVSCSALPLRSDRPRGIYHRVKSGETLSVIARAYHVNLQDLAETNNISNPDQIAADSVLFIPDVNQIVDDVLTAAKSQEVRPPPPQPPPSPQPPKQAPVAEAPVAKSPAVPAAAAPPIPSPKREPVTEAAKPPVRPPAAAVDKPRASAPGEAEKEMAARRISPKPQAETGDVRPAKPKEPDQKQEGLQFDKDRFSWPLRGKILTRFGIQPNGMYSNGIRIAAGEGAMVQAAAGGLVIFSATLKDYGETIIIQHDDQYATVYTHLGTRAVRSDIRVKRGERIAFLGPTGGREEPYLHFEIRHQTKPRNPLFFLP
jgi:lipoprotein NlpD